MSGIESRESPAYNIVRLRPKDAPLGLEDVSADVDEQMLELLKAEIRGALKPDAQSGDHREIDLFPDDIQSIRSETRFRDRFGFVLGKRGRMAVVRFMDEYDLTSYDVRALYKIGSMTWDGTTLRLRYMFWFKLFGFSQIFVLALILLPVLLVLFKYADAHWQVRLLLIFMLAALMSGITWVHRSFIAPFNRLKQRRSK